MTTIKIYGPIMGSGLKCHWVAAELGIAYESVGIDFSKRENRSDWYLEVNPMGQIPALVEGDFKLAESLAIVSYLIEKSGSDLGGKTAEERASAWQWSLWAAFNPGPQLSKLASPAWTHQPLAPEVETAAKEGASRYLAILDKHLASRPYVTGANFTVGDINVASALGYAFLAKFDLSPFPNVLSWIGKVTARPSYAKATAESKK